MFIIQKIICLRKYSHRYSSPYSPLSLVTNKKVPAPNHLHHWFFTSYPVRYSFFAVACGASPAPLYHILMGPARFEFLWGSLVFIAMRNVPSRLFGFGNPVKSDSAQTAFRPEGFG